MTEEKDHLQSLAETMLGLPRTVEESQEYRRLLEHEDSIGTDKLMAEILEKKVWKNEEMIWMLRRLIYWYGRSDALLKKTPVDRLFANMCDILRAFHVFLDRENPDIDENTRSYMSAKLGDAMWGITDNTRIYLEKLP